MNRGPSKPQVLPHHPTVPDPSINPPEIIGPYRDVRPVATGGMGVICRAVDSRLDRPVALKWLIDRAGNGSDNVLRREARLAARLRHPGLVRIYGLEEHIGISMVVMEWVEGQSLQTLIASGRTWRPREAARLLALVADALGQAHASGIVHCDIKPANIIIGPDGRPTVLDFGIAVDLTDSAGSRGRLTGTAAYMAPEQVSSSRPSPSADVFSLGAVAWEMILGTPVYGDAAHGDSSSIDDIVRRPAPDFSGVEDRLGGMAPVIRAALSTKPGSRPENGQVLAAALRQVAASGDGPQTAGPDSRKRRRPRRRAKPRVSKDRATADRPGATSRRTLPLVVLAGLLIFFSVGMMMSRANTEGMLTVRSDGGGGGGGGGGGAGLTPPPPQVQEALIRVVPSGIPYVLGDAETGAILLRGPNSESPIIFEGERGLAARLVAPGYVSQDRNLQPGMNEFVLVPDSVHMEITTNRDAFAQVWRTGERSAPAFELPVTPGRPISVRVPSGTYWLAISPNEGQCIWRRIELDRRVRENDPRLNNPERHRISVLIPEPSAGAPVFPFCGPPGSG